MSNFSDNRRPGSFPALDGIRLAKRVAELVPCSRSEAEQFIEGGWVTVNGVVVEEPQHRVDHHTVLVSKDASLLGLAAVTLLLHKPAGQPDTVVAGTPDPAENIVLAYALNFAKVKAGPEAVEVLANLLGCQLDST